MRSFHFAICVGLAAVFTEAFEVSGRIFAEADGRPVAGALVRLLRRGDSVFTDSAGSFRLNPDHTGMRPSASPRAYALRSKVHAGMLEFNATGGDAVRIDLYGTDGKALGSLFHQPASAGVQRVRLAPLTAALRGMGWLRIRAGGGQDWVRIFSMGEGSEPAGLAPKSGTSESHSPKAEALAKAAIGYIDSLRVEKAGYYPYTRWVEDSTSGSGPYQIILWKNTAYGMDPAELEAWKAYLNKPAMTIRIGPFGVGLPAGLTEGKVELADGTEAGSWSADPCLPGPRPKSVRLAYARAGREYRDTVRLEALWNLLDSYRVAGVDSLSPFRGRYHLAWDWPKGFSALPERDGIKISLIKDFTDYHSDSRPDAFQNGVGYGIEGGLYRYDAFDPARGNWTLTGPLGARHGINAEFTIASREDHDLRIVLDDGARRPQVPIRFSFLNAWPDGGLVPAGTVLPLRAKVEPADSSALLELVPEGAGEGLVVKSPWNGSALDWSFPFPIRDTLAFRLKTWDPGELGLFPVCQIPALSPVLLAIPSGTDSAAEAFEPNESPSEAARIPMGRWIEAAWDYRPFGGKDADHYRFQAPAGSRFRFQLRNPNGKWILLDQTFSNANSGFGPEGGEEMEMVYTMKDSGDQYFDVRPIDFPAGRYSFRIDPVP